MGRKKKRMRLALRKELTKTIIASPKEPTLVKETPAPAAEETPAPKKTVEIKTVEVKKAVKKKVPSRSASKKTTKKS